MFKAQAKMKSWGLIHIEAQFIHEIGSDCRSRPHENGCPDLIRTPFWTF